VPARFEDRPGLGIVAASADVVLLGGDLARLVDTMRLAH